MKKLAEAESGTKNVSAINKKFKDAGYKKIGSGVDSTVWAKDEQSVIKILMPDDPTNNAEKTFLKFYNFVRKYKSLENLPKFLQAKDYFDINGIRYTFVVMERLYPIPKKSFNEAIVWIMSDLATQKLNWEQALTVIKNKNTWSLFHDGMNPKKIVQIIDSMSELDLAKFGMLFTLMTLMYHTGQINRLGWDLHTENVMQRQDGTLVIIDPWFGLGDGI
jgi:hypothetical protein